jgi:hypothetical protein
MNLLLTILALLVLLASLTLAIRQLRRHRSRRAWQSLAPKLELSLTQGKRLIGRYKGMPVEVLLTNGAAQIRMATQAELPPGLHLSRQEPGARRLLGVRDIQVGDKPLDDAVLIQAENPAATIRLLRDPTVRNALLEFLAEHPKAVVTGNEVVVPVEEQPDEALGLRVLRSQQRLATALMASAGQRQEQVLEAREQARREALPAGRQLPDRPHPKPLPSPSLRSLREIFAQRRWLHGLLSYPPIFGGLLLAFISKGTESGLFKNGLSPAWATVGFCLFMAGLVAQTFGGYFIVRCPACGGTLEKRVGGKIAVFETKVCPHCQMRLS